MPSILIFKDDKNQRRTKTRQPGLNPGFLPQIKILRQSHHPLQRRPRLTQVHAWTTLFISIYADILFLIAFTICSSLILFILYSYFAKFSVFWKIVSVVSGGGFILSYLNVGFSKPGIARAKGPIDSRTREEYRFCRIC